MPLLRGRIAVHVYLAFIVSSTLHSSYPWCIPSLGVTTHVVVTNAKGLKAKDGRAIADRRTQKYMCAVLHGAWVVTTQWVSACVAAKHILTGPHPSAGEPVSKAAGASNSSKEDICHLEELYEVN